MQPDQINPNKDNDERNIFRRFVRTAGLLVDLESINSPQPPHPDIFCTLNHVPHYFELTRMTQKNYANAMGHHLSQLTKTGAATPLGADIYNPEGALRKIIEEKGEKTYETLGHSVSLMIYLDGVFYPPGMRSSSAQMILEEEGTRYSWYSTWLYNAASDQVLAHWSKKYDENDIYAYGKTPIKKGSLLDGK